MKLIVYYPEPEKSRITNFYNIEYKRQHNNAVCDFKNACILSVGQWSREIAVFSGVVSENGEFLKESSPRTWLPKIPPVDVSVPYINQDVVFMGGIWNHYGHFLLESTARLWWYLENVNDSRPLVFAYKDEIPRYVFEFLDLLGINRDRLLFIQETTRFRSVAVPWPSYVHREYYTDKFFNVYNKAADSVTPAHYRKVYLSRNKWSRGAGTPLGEVALERYFVDKCGYQSVSMELLTLREQIAVIKGAESIAGINGTALHNVVFAQNKEVIILNRTPFVDAQHLVNQANGHTTHFVKAHSNPLKVPHAVGPFIMKLDTKHGFDLAKNLGYPLPDKTNINVYYKQFWKDFRKKYYRYRYDVIYEPPTCEEIMTFIKLMDEQNFTTSLFYLHFIRLIQRGTQVCPFIKKSVKEQMKQKYNKLKQLRDKNVEFPF